MKKIIIALVAIGVVLFIAMRAFDSSNVTSDVDEYYVIDQERINTMLPGEWQSTDDVLSVRVFNADGSLSEVYDGEVLGGPYTWEVLSQEEFVPQTNNAFTDEDYDWYLRIKGEAEQDTLEFILLDIMPDRLVLSYLARGNTLFYKRVE